MAVPARAEMDVALFARMGPELAGKVKNARVAVCGLGGLGSNIAFALARAGVGELVLIDFDRVDVSNLNRQQYKACQVGMDKPSALAENLLEIAPYISLETHFERVTADNAAGLLRGAGVVCEAFDVPEEKSMLADAVLSSVPEAYLVAASGMAGLGPANSIRTRRIGRRMYLCGDGVSDVSTGLGLVAPRVMLCAAHQALAVLRILAGEFDV